VNPYFAPCGGLREGPQRGWAFRVCLAFSRWRLLRKGQALAVEQRQYLHVLKRRGVPAETDLRSYELSLTMLEHAIEAAQEGRWFPLREFMNFYEEQSH